MGSRVLRLGLHLKSDVLQVLPRGNPGLPFLCPIRLTPLQFDTKRSGLSFGTVWASSSLESPGSLDWVQPGSTGPGGLSVPSSHLHPTETFLVLESTSRREIGLRQGFPRLQCLETTIVSRYPDRKELPFTLLCSHKWYLYFSRRMDPLYIVNLTLSYLGRFDSSFIICFRVVMTWVLWSVVRREGERFLTLHKYSHLWYHS